MSDGIRQLREEVAWLATDLTRLTEIEAVRRCKYQYYNYGASLLNPVTVRAF